MAGVSLAAFVAAPGAATAQGSDIAGEVEDVITVTAQRREQSAQDVGIALNAFDGEQLKDLGVQTINNLENHVASLQVESQFGSGQPNFFIRQVGFRDYATLNSPTVGIYVDDVAYPIPVMTQGVLFDIERVEVLRGPQGTLYGRNTTAGAIKVVSASPTEEFAAGVSVEAGRFGRVDVDGYVSGAINDRVRFRLSGVTEQGGDWQVNRETGETLGDAERYALRGIVDADLSDTVTARINLHGFVDESDGLGLQLFNPSATGPAAHAGRRETSFGSSTEFANLVGIDVDEAPFRKNEGWGANLRLNAALGAGDLTYIGSIETIQRKEFNDFDALTVGFAGVYFESDAEVQTHEVRFTSTDESRFRWIAGAYYSNEDLDELYQSDFVASFGPGFAVSTPYRQDVQTIAGYLHGEFDITDRLTLIGGVRYEDEERKLRDLGTFATGFGPFNFANGTTDGTLENRDLNQDNLSGKAGLNYKPVDDLLLYASYSRGVKSGGFTAYNTLNPRAIDPFLPEKLDAFEVGFKGDFLENRAQVNGAVFYYDYKNQQVLSGIFDTGTGATVGRIQNAGGSEIYGGELEVVFRANEWLTIGQSISYTEGEFTEFSDLDVAASNAAGREIRIDRSGEELGFPNLVYQGYLLAETPVGEKWRAGGRFDYGYRDETAVPLLGPAYTVDSYWLANAQIDFGPRDNRWRVALWGRNIFNTDYDETRNFFAFPGGFADIAAPGMVATYGVRVDLRY